MPEMDEPSLHAATLLDALVDLDAHLCAIRSYLHRRPEVKKLYFDWTLAHNLGIIGQDPPVEPLVYRPDQSTHRHTHAYVDAELLDGTTLVAYVMLGYGSFGWRLTYYVEVRRPGFDENTIRFPIVETGRLEEIASALQRAGDDLIEAVRTIDLQKI
jgi:hypothetical protein